MRNIEGERPFSLQDETDSVIKFLRNGDKPPKEIGTVIGNSLNLGFDEKPKQSLIEITDFSKNKKEPVITLFPDIESAIASFKDPEAKPINEQKPIFQRRPLARLITILASKI